MNATAAAAEQHKWSELRREPKEIHGSYSVLWTRPVPPRSVRGEEDIIHQTPPPPMADKIYLLFNSLTD